MLEKHGWYSDVCYAMCIMYVSNIYRKHKMSSVHSMIMMFKILFVVTIIEICVEYWVSACLLESPKFLFKS